MAENLCVMCNENKAGGDGLCVKCRFKLNTQHMEGMTDREILLPEGRYFGKTKNGIPNGKGEITYNDHDFRRSYSGEFRDGMRQGKGKLVFRNEAYYDGEWMHDKYDGYGEEYLPGGNILEGFYSNGKLVNGHVYFGDGREYDGEWNEDMPNGMGKMFFHDGHAEEGYWVNGICAFKEKPTEEQMALFLAEQEHQALNENLIEQEQDALLNALNTTPVTEGIKKLEPINDVASAAETPYSIESAASTETAASVETAASLETFSGAETTAGTEITNRTENTNSTETIKDTEMTNGTDTAASLAGLARTEKETAPAAATTVKNGYFVEKYANGEIYEGDFIDGKRHGRGKMSYPNGDVYEGGYVLGKRHGYGQMTYAAGSTYAGEWQNSMKSGKGVFTAANGEHYDGEFENGAFSGHGIFYFANGNQYDGEWKANHREGTGILTKSDGQKEEQVWENGKKVSSKPVSLFKSFTYKSGNRYEGEVNEKNQPNGIGIYTFTNGCVYEGNFSSGTRDGIGRFTWATGDYYEGEWQKDMRHGQGRMCYANGKVKEGQFVNNEFVG